VHQHTGQIFCYRHLAGHLGDERPIYGLVPRGLDGRQPPWMRIEDMAAHNVTEIRAQQPRGPYHLAGVSCFGGIVAFEMAQQLLAQGQRVSLLAMLQGAWHARLSAPNRLLRALSRRIRFEWQHLAREAPAHRLQYLARRGANYALDHWNATLTFAKDMSTRARPQSPVEQTIRRIAAANDLAIAHYEPAVYPGRITLFRAARVPAMFHGDPTLGWRPLAPGGVEVHEIKNTGPTILDEPDVRILAEKLRACLGPEGQRVQEPGIRGANRSPRRESPRTA
jgi:thioesterase domain-containing protein